MKSTRKRKKAGRTMMVVGRTSSKWTMNSEGDSYLGIDCMYWRTMTKRMKRTKMRRRMSSELMCSTVELERPSWDYNLRLGSDMFGCMRRCRTEMRPIPSSLDSSALASIEMMRCGIERLLRRAGDSMTTMSHCRINYYTLVDFKKDIKH